jgi:signal transduction histidine kinase
MIPAKCISSFNTMIRILFFTLGLLCSLPGFSQESILDSLQKELEMAKSDKARLSILIELSDQLFVKDSKKAQEYAEEALELSQQLGNLPAQAESQYFLAYIYYFLYREQEALGATIACDSLCKQTGDRNLQADVLYIQGVIHMALGNLEEAKTSYKQCQEVGESAGHPGAQINALKGLGDLHETEGEYQLALEKYQQALEIALKDGTTRATGVAYNDIGRIYDQMGDYDRGLENYLKGLFLAEENNHPRVAAALSGNIASIHFFQQNYEKAREYARVSIRQNEILGNRKGVGTSLQTIGNTFYNEANNEEALIYFLQVRDIMEEIENKRGLSFAYFNLGKTYNQLLDLEKALFYHQKSLKLREELGYKVGMAGSYRALGRIEMESKNYQKALPHLSLALSMAEEAGAMQDVNESYEALSEYYMWLGDFKQAYAYQKRYAETKDSLFNEDRNEQIANMQTRYETQKKEKALLESKNQLLAERADKTRLRNQRNSILGGGLGLAILGFFGFQLNKARRQRNEKIAFAEALIFAQEAERRRIARDLHDGIGQSLLIIKRQMAANQEASLENQELIAETLEEVRAISRDLHPSQLEKFGLTAAIEEALRKIERSSDLFVSKEIENIDQLVPSAAQIHLFRTVQESLSNIVKHADATAAKVTIQSTEKEVLIKIQDNGKGFDHELAIVTSKSLGLRTMQERISSIGGKLTINPGPSNGTAIDIRIPTNTS